MSRTSTGRTRRIGPTTRGTAVAMHAFCFFLGQTVGPIAYGFGLAHTGKVVTLSGAAIVVLLLGIVCARLLAHRTGS